MMSRWLIAMTAAAPLLASAGNDIAFPADYRDWAHVKTLTLHAAHPLADPFQGIHHVYANPRAVTGVKGGSYPDGAKLVFDLLSVEESEQASSEGGRVLLAVMERDATRFAATGGWGFQAWPKGQPGAGLVKDGGAGCFACHAGQAETHYVFSRWRD